MKESLDGTCDRAKSGRMILMHLEHELWALDQARFTTDGAVKKIRINRL